LVNAFGDRGARYAEHYLEPGAIQRERQQIAGFHNAPGVRTEQEELAKAPLQQFEQSLARLSDVGNQLGTAVLPGVNSALGLFTKGLEAATGFLQNHPGVAEAGGYGVLGLIGLGALGIGGKILSGVMGVGRSALGLVTGAAGGAGAAAGGLGDLIVGGGGAAGATALSTAIIGPLAAIGAGIAALLAGGAAAGKMQVPVVDQFGRVVGNWSGRDESRNPAFVGPHEPGSPAVQDFRPTAYGRPAGPQQGPTTNVTNNNHVSPTFNITGLLDENTWREISNRLVEMIRTAVTTATAAAGTTESSYATSGAIP
jgi:hypothetical protein